MTTENKFSKDTAMSFTYNESVHRYVAESGVLAPGSSYRLVTGNATATETVTFFTGFNPEKRTDCSTAAFLV